MEAAVRSRPRRCTSRSCNSLGAAIKSELSEKLQLDHVRSVCGKLLQGARASVPHSIRSRGDHVPVLGAERADPAAGDRAGGSLALSVLLLPPISKPRAHASRWDSLLSHLATGTSTSMPSLTVFSQPRSSTPVAQSTTRPSMIRPRGKTRQQCSAICGVCRLCSIKQEVSTSSSINL